MDEVFENIHSCNSKDFEDVFQIKKMETREEKHNDNK